VAGGITSSYVYDGEDIVREVKGGTTLRYVHGPGMDEPLAREDGSGALTYMHTDGLGSIVKHTSQAGVVVHEYRYDPWGEIEVGASEPGFAFSGREWDPEVGLFYYRARYYDPKAGRFLSEDVARADLNLYAYANMLAAVRKCGNLTGLSTWVG
jgi:RHS repeat-associated protein